MTATGNIKEDLAVIRDILEGTGGPERSSRGPWWGAPASEESIGAMAVEYGELPQDMIDFYRVTDVATFDPQEDPQEGVRGRIFGAFDD